MCDSFWMTFGCETQRRTPIGVLDRRPDKDRRFPLDVGLRKRSSWNTLGRPQLCSGRPSAYYDDVDKYIFKYVYRCSKRNS